MAGDVSLDYLGSFAVNYYVNLAAFTLLVYDYCLTFVPEVERFWCCSTLNWATGFFYFNRYVSLFGHAPVMMEFFWSTMSPRKISSYHQYLAIVIQLVVACMMIMRTYALYSRSSVVLALLIGVAITVVAVGCWSILGAKKENYPDVLIPIGCASSLTHYQATRLGAAWGGMAVFDTLVFGLTLYKALAIPRTKDITLLTVLLRDGTVYFCVIIGANLGNILTFLFGTPYTSGVTTTFTNVISSIMISRLMLNLRHPSLTGTGKSASMTSTDPLTYPNLTFFEPTRGSEYSEEVDQEGLGSRGELHAERGRARVMYDYLAKGSNRKNHDYDSIELLERRGPLV